MNPTTLTRYAPLLVLLIFCCLRAEARSPRGESSQDVELSSPVRSGARTTYFELLRELFPDLQRDATAHRSIPFRSLSEPRKREAVAGDIKFEFKPYWFKSEGRRLLLLWVSLKAEGANEGTPYEGEADVLAVYSLEPRVRLLDSLDVKTDRFTGFWKDRPVFHLDSRSDAFIVYSTHGNAGESYTSLEMLFVDAGRLKTIASQFLYETEGCGASYTERPEFRAAADAGRKYPKVLVSVELRKKPDEAQCEHPTRGYTRYFRGLYRWNAFKGGYESKSRQLESFDKFNEKRVSSP
ncbi:MAG: hypothetical protein M3348_12235 [Acidobacteriota bacterium]|nr:hypothetical protein [Acidobacteriota bacterium]